MRLHHNHSSVCLLFLADLLDSVRADITLSPFQNMVMCKAFAMQGLTSRLHITEPAMLAVQFSASRCRCGTDVFSAACFFRPFQCSLSTVVSLVTYTQITPLTLAQGSIAHEKKKKRSRLMATFETSAKQLT